MLNNIKKAIIFIAVINAISFILNVTVFLMYGKVLNLIVAIVVAIIATICIYKCLQYKKEIEFYLKGTTNAGTGNQD